MPLSLKLNGNSSNTNTRTSSLKPYLSETCWAPVQPSPTSSAGPGPGQQSADVSVHSSRPSEAAASVASDPSFHGPGRVSGEDTCAVAAAGSPAVAGTPPLWAGGNGVGGSTRGGSAAVGALQRSGGGAGPLEPEPEPEGPDSAPSDNRLLRQVPCPDPAAAMALRHHHPSPSGALLVRSPGVPIDNVKECPISPVTFAAAQG